MGWLILLINCKKRHSLTRPGQFFYMMTSLTKMEFESSLMSKPETVWLLGTSPKEVVRNIATLFQPCIVGYPQKTADFRFYSVLSQELLTALLEGSISWLPQLFT